VKLALIFFSVLTSLSLWFGAQDKQPITCSGKPLPIMLLPGPKMSGPELPLRFGGSRPFPRPPINGYKSDNSFRLVIRTTDEFSDFWKKFTTSFQPKSGDTTAGNRLLERHGDRGGNGNEADVRLSDYY